MYNETVIQKLKQNNVSKDIEKTKQRMETLWKSASKADRQTVMSLANVALVTMQRVYKIGSISAKLVVPLAQTFNVNPYYLTGESDDQGVCTEELLNEFLIKCGYRDIVIEYSSTARKKRKINKQDDIAIQETLDDMGETEDVLDDKEVQPLLNVDEIKKTESVYAKDEEIPKTPVISAESQALADNLTEDEMILLLRATILREKSSGANAELANKLKLLLLGIELN